MRGQQKKWGNILVPLVVYNMLVENKRRNAVMTAYFNPVTGEGSILERTKVEIKDFPIPVQYLPNDMLQVPLVKGIVKYGSMREYAKRELDIKDLDDATRLKFIDEFVRIRYRYDFCFWCAVLVYIKKKGGGDDIRFVLNRSQRRLVLRFERKRMAGKPIRLILLKARQWGGSTCTQLYMAWLQLVHQVGLNSLIVAHVKDTSTEIKDMFDRMMSHYPIEMLYEMGASYNVNEPKMVGVGQSGNIHRIPQRNCKIKIGTAEKPESARGGDYNLVHCSEVAMWKKTDGKTPEQIVRSACSGILLRPYTMIVYESTANGTGNFFHTEYEAAKEGKSQFEALFIAWYDIEQYAIAFDDKNIALPGVPTTLVEFAQWLYKNRNNRNVNSNREESGKYLYWLWEKGATLEAINWYIHERAGKSDHGQMASEYPSDDEEAFVHSGARVFDKSQVNRLRKACKPPKYVGDVYGKGDEGEEALDDLHFREDSQGLLWIWEKPEYFDDEDVTDRYLTVVDVGGRTSKADWSVILVLDRYWMMEGDKPTVVAQWYGHIDIDLLAWKAAQIAAYYDNSLLVIESNTIETHDKERHIEGGDQSQFILNQLKEVYPNLYARKQSEEEINEGWPVKYGFHTNVATKPMIISTLVKVIRESLYVERDERCLDEYLTYERKQNGAYGAISGKHDDLLMTRAIGLHICFFEMELPQRIKRTSMRIRRRKAVSAATF
jgi:hypothetical protein